MFAAVAGGEIFYRVLGEGEPLLMIHGGPDWDHSYLLPAADRLSELHQVILFDIRGCGQSTRFDDVSQYTMANILADIEALLDHLDIDTCHVLGFSFGGMVAANLLATNHSVFRSLVLASAACHDDFQQDLHDTPGYRDRCSTDIQQFMQYCFREAPADEEEPSRSMALGCLALDVGELEHVDRIRPTIEKVRFSSEWIRAFRAGHVQTPAVDLAELINRQQIKTLIIHGTKDYRFPVLAARRLARQCPTARLCEVEDAGHMAHLEATTMWCDQVGQFLLEQTTAA